MAATASEPMIATHTTLTFCTSGDSAASDSCARGSASSSDEEGALLRAVESVGGGQEVSGAISPRSAAGARARSLAPATPRECAVRAFTRVSNLPAQRADLRGIAADSAAQLRVSRIESGG